MGDAASRWAEVLGAWAIPPEILERAPESPWGCPTGIFAHSAEESVAPGAERTPTVHRALEALPEGGSVLDVGAGGGAASLPLAPPAGRVTAVDQSPAMLEAFAALAGRRGITHTEVEGNWPDVAAEVGPADVVVCAHVLYNVADLVPFLAALTAKAQRRVVVEITEVHPMTSLNPLWRRFYGTDRPDGPTAADALAVAEDMGIEAGVEHWEGLSRWHSAPKAELVTFARRRLCLPAERDAEIAAAVDDLFDPGTRQLATLWWAGGA